MNSTSTQFMTPRRMGIYDPMHEISMWGDSFRINGQPNASLPPIIEMDTKIDQQSEDTSNGSLGLPSMYGQQATKYSDKIKRRQAQNREAAKKSRLRKKAYVQQLETSRLKLEQLEQELKRARQQGLYMGGGVEGVSTGLSGHVNSAITSFEMEYSHWVEEQNRQTSELRIALQTHISDVELKMLVEGGKSHYFKLFHMKAVAAKADVFHVMSGMWKTPAERLFFWIGGFRPSELLKVLVPQLEPMTDKQRFEIFNLRQSCEQAEEALSQGMDKLQQTLSDNVVDGYLTEGGPAPPRTGTAMEKLNDLVNFVNQADHLRRESLQQMSFILTTREAAKGLLTLGEYFQRLRALNSLWATRPNKSA